MKQLKIGSKLFLGGVLLAHSWTAQAQSLILQWAPKTDPVTQLSYNTVRVPTVNGANNPLTTRPYFTQMPFTQNGRYMILGVPNQPLSGSGDTQGPVYIFDTTVPNSNGSYIDTMSFYGGHIDATIPPQNNIFYIKRDLNYVYKRNLASSARIRVGQYPASGLSSYAWGLKVNNVETNLSLNWYTNGLFQNVNVLTNAVATNVYTEPTTLPSFTTYLKTFTGPGTYKHIGHATINPVRSNTVLFAHEGPTEQILDRIWVFDPTLATADHTQNIFTQQVISTADGPRTTDPCGHECWSRNGDSVYFVKYNLPITVGNAGIYRISRTGTGLTFLDGSHEYLHVASSPRAENSGDWLVADTKIVQEPSGAYYSKIVLIDARGPGPVKAKQLLKVRVLSGHPGHAHPSFSPDGTKISFGVVDQNGNLCVGWMDISYWINNGLEAPNPVSGSQY